MAPIYKGLTSRKAVFAAMAEYDRLGAEAFRKRYGYSEAREYTVTQHEKVYDSKAIVGVAFGYQWPENGPLKSEAFSGGRGHAAGHLMRLGFEVEGVPRNPEHWTLAEVEEIVRTYFEMVDAYLGPGYSRGKWIKTATDRVSERDASAIERKISNICAILKGLGLPYLPGFGSLGNKQTLLTALVTDWLVDHPETFDQAPAVARSIVGMIQVEPPSKALVEAVRGERKGSLIDFTERDARNRALGDAGEAWALAYLRSELVAQGAPELAERVVWASKALGDGLGYDILSFNSDGTQVRIEVKTTNGNIGAPFMLSRNEVNASREGDDYVLMRIFDFSGEPRFYVLKGSLEESCQLQPRVYAALPLQGVA